jgi:hypothetical protein
VPPVDAGCPTSAAGQLETPAHARQHLLHLLAVLLLLLLQLLVPWRRRLLLLLPVQLQRLALLPGALLKSPPRLTGQQYPADSAGAHLHSKSQIIQWLREIIQWLQDLLKYLREVHPCQQVSSARLTQRVHTCMVKHRWADYHKQS